MKPWKKYVTTGVVYYCNIALGIGISFIAPAMIDIQDGFSTTTKNISLIMTLGRFLALGSALAFGVIFNYVNRQVAVIFLVSAVGILTAFILYTRSLVIFGVIYALLNISAGGYLTAQIVWIIDIWKEAAGPFIQAQHFFFALGLIFPPLIFEPYLSSNATDKTGSDDLQKYYHGETKLVVGDSNDLYETFQVLDAGTSSEKPTSETYDLARLYPPCAICGSIVTAGGILLLVSYCILRRSKETLEESTEEASTPSTSDSTSGVYSSEAESQQVEKRNSTGQDEDEAVALLTKRKMLIKKIILIVLSSILIGGVESMEGITLGFLPVYSHYSSLHLSTAEGAQLLSAYTIAYTAARGVGILIILKVPARWILCGNLLVIIIANALLLLLSNSLTWMYVGAVLLGIGFSTSVPSVFAYAQLHLEVTNFIGSLLTVAGALVAAVFPIIVGSFIEGTPTILLFLNLGCVVVCIFSLVGIVMLMRNTSGKL